MGKRDLADIKEIWYFPPIMHTSISSCWGRFLGGEAMCLYARKCSNHYPGDPETDGLQILADFESDTWDQQKVSATCILFHRAAKSHQLFLP